MKAKTKQSSNVADHKVKYNAALDALANKNLFPEKLEEANKVLSKGGLPVIEKH